MYKLICNFFGQNVAIFKIRSEIALISNSFHFYFARYSFISSKSSQISTTKRLAISKHPMKMVASSSSFWRIMHQALSFVSSLYSVFHLLEDEVYHSLYQIQEIHHASIILRGTICIILTTIACR